MTFRTALFFAFSVTFAQAAPTQAAKYGDLPLAFEPNRGQGDPTAQYFARGNGYTIALQQNGATLNMRGRDARISATVLRFVGAAAGNPVAQEPLGGKVNYFLGSDSSKWRTGIATFGRVSYPRLYPGIDIVYYGNQKRLEYDLLVAPHADVSRIRMAVGGARRVFVDGNGDLVIGDGPDAVRQHKPRVYQRLANGQSTPIDGRYVVDAKAQVGFQVGAYDHSRQLVIDPVLSYATYLGGSGNESVIRIKVDATGSLYMTGFTTSANFPATAGALQTKFGGSNSSQLATVGDGFVAKLNPTGTALVFATYIGGSDEDVAGPLALDASGNVYVGGSTRSTNFPVTAGALQTKFGGLGSNGQFDPGDGFLLKLNPTGSQLLYSTYLGGSMNDAVIGLALRSDGSVVAVGATDSTNFPLAGNAIVRNYRGAASLSPLELGDAFISVLNPTGTALTFSTYLGGRNDDAALGVALDAQNNMYVCGGTYSPDFPTTPGAYQVAFKGVVSTTDFDAAAGDAFVAKISPQGALLYSTFIGGGYRDGASAIAVDASGAAYITGLTGSRDFPIAGNAIQSTFQGSGRYGVNGDFTAGDAFVAKLSPDGTTLVYSTYLGGPGDEPAADITLDPSGNILVAGMTTSKEFPVTSDALQKTFGGLGGQGLVQRPGDAFNTGDAFIVKISPAGVLLYSSFFGGAGDDAGTAVAVDTVGNVYLGGNTVSSNLTTSAGALQRTFGGSTSSFPRGDGFVAKFDFGGKLPPAPTALNVISGFIAAGSAGSMLSSPFTVEVLDADSKPITGVTVTFAATNATVSPTSAMTDPLGRASTNVTLGPNAGTGTVSATVAGLAPASVTLTIAAPVVGPVVRAVTNGASFSTKVSPGSWISLFVENINVARADASAVPLPTLLGGVRVRVNGTPIPLVVIVPTSAGTAQINAQLPYETPAGTAQATVEFNGATSAAFSFPVLTSAPGIFTFGDNRAVVQNVAADGTVTVNTATNPIPAGGLVIIYFTGQGPLDNPIPTGSIAGSTPLSRPQLPYSVKIGGKTAAFDFVGMTPGLIALDQANVHVPADLPPGDYPVVVTLGGQDSNGPVISVSAPVSAAARPAGNP